MRKEPTENINDPITMMAVIFVDAKDSFAIKSVIHYATCASIFLIESVNWGESK